MEFIKNFLKNKTVAFYITLGAAGISVIAAIIYVAGFGGLGKYMSWLAFTFLLAGPAAFFALAFLGFTKMGAAAMALFDFAALLLAVDGAFGFIQDYMMVGLDNEGAAFSLFVVGAVLMAICAVAACVTAWLSLQKKQVSAT